MRIIDLMGYAFNLPFVFKSLINGRIPNCLQGVSFLFGMPLIQSAICCSKQFITLLLNSINHF